MAYKSTGTASKSASGASMSKYDVEVEARLKKLEAKVSEISVIEAMVSSLERSVDELKAHSHDGGGSTGDVSAVIYYRNLKFSGTNQINWEPHHAPHLGTMNRGWQRFVYTFTAPAVNANNTILAFELSFNVTTYFTGFQLEEGSQATPFEFTNKAEELELCRRYFQQIKAGSNFMQFGVGFTYGTQSDGNSILHVKLPTPMRAVPSFSYLGTLSQYYEPHNGTQSNITSMTLVQYDVDYKQFDLLIVGTTSTQKLMWIATLNNTATGFLFDAEL